MWTRIRFASLADGVPTKCYNTSMFRPSRSSPPLRRPCSDMDILLCYQIIPCPLPSETQPLPGTLQARAIGGYRGPVWDCFPTVGMQAANSLTIVTLPFRPLAMQPCLVITPSAYVGASKLSPYEVAVATGIGAERSGGAYQKVRAGGWGATRVRHS
jgi:hypothetical protein